MFDNANQYQTRGGFSNMSRGGSNRSNLPIWFQPKHRLNTLFAIHAVCSVFIGVVGYLCPHAASFFFLTESTREKNVAQVIIRLFSCLITAQGIMIWKARSINDGEIKRAFVLAYFLCFLFSTLALTNEHMQDRGVVSGRFLGIMKIFSFFFLTLSYGWFTFFQPPVVFNLGY